MNTPPPESPGSRPGHPTLADVAREWGLPLHRIVSGPGALSELPAILSEVMAGGPAIVGLLTDGVPKSCPDGDVTAVVAGLLPGDGTRTILVPAGAHGVVLDESTVADTVAATTGVDVLVVVGSGTVVDLSKVAAQANGSRLVVVQTAASVNGYSDSLSVLVRNGAKRTSTTAWPDALIADHDVIAAAPDRLTRAGVGDAVAVWSAPADWYLACALGLDGPYDTRPVDAVLGAAQGLTGDSPRSAASRTALVDTLTLGGLGIGVTGTTASLSGSEHLISHLLDMAAMAESMDHDLHGAQVGVATVLAAALWQVGLQLLDDNPPTAAGLAIPGDLRERVEDSWSALDPSGRLGAECWSAVQAKFARWTEHQDAVAAALAEWPRHLDTLRGLVRSAEHPARVLGHWGAPQRFGDLRPPVSDERARWALDTLPFMRDRFTLADLLLLRGEWTPDVLDRAWDVARSAVDASGRAGSV